MAPAAAGVAAASFNQSYPPIYAPSAMVQGHPLEQSCAECEECAPEKTAPCPGCVEACPDQSTCDEECTVVCNELCPEGICSNGTCADEVTRDGWTCEDVNCVQLNALLPESCAPHSRPSQHWVNATQPINWKSTPSADWLPSQKLAPIWTAYQSPGLNPSFNSNESGTQCDIGRYEIAPVLISPTPISVIDSPAPDLRLDQSAKSCPCLWSGCAHSFASRVELMNHVNLAHVPFNVPPLPLPSSAVSASPTDVSALDCQWGGCQGALTWTMSDDGLPWTPDFEYEVLARHFIQEHLGLPPEVSHVCTADCEHKSKDLFSSSALPTQPTQPMCHSISAPSASNSPASPTTTSPTVSSSPLSPAAISALSPSGSRYLRCLWNRCGETFITAEDLTAHLTEAHVGSGHSSYECHWANCDRQGGKSFSSKQKVLRHLQAHTGYRPFKCPRCDQFFSEAATLQQHVRRHTNEKPFVCDFPGCGKAFAITGALTIHKRTHNGEKPFKCKYCDRRFSESSNLTKHLRIHTGSRPYACVEPGCGKHFSRPDQLSRHTMIHQKREQGISLVPHSKGTLS